MNVYTVIVTYNGQKWIKKCLELITAQSKVVVIDNCSTDNTLSIIYQHFPEVICLPQTSNYGFGVANNIGITYALQQGASAVFLLNQDAYVSKNCIQNLIIASQKNKAYGIISPLHYNGDASSVDLHFLKFISTSYQNNLVSDLILKDKNQENIYPLNFVNAAAWFITKATLLTVGGFDPMFFLYGEDDNYCQRVLFHQFKIGVITNCFIQHDSPNNNSKPVVRGSNKEMMIFYNNVKVKYANVNNHNHQKINRFKIYLLKEAFKNLLLFNYKKAMILYKKSMMIDANQIKNSVQNNRLKKANYLYESIS